MAFDLTGLTAYTDETSQELVKKSILTGRTIDLVKVIPGLKGITQLNILQNDVVIKPATCGFTTGDGDVTFEGVDITVKPLEVKEELCAKDLETYWMGQMMKPGAATDVPFQEVIADSYVEKVQKANELNIWQGDLAGAGTGGYENFDGFTTNVTPAGGAVAVTAAAGPHTTANIIAHVEAMILAIPEDILDQDDLTFFMSYEAYNTYTSALRTANLFHYNGAVGADYTTTIPGTNVKAVATKGLSGTGTISNAITAAKDVFFISNASNMVVGVDMLNEEEKFMMKYDEFEDNVKVNIQWKMGTQVYFQEFCVINYPDAA